MLPNAKFKNLRKEAFYNIKERQQVKGMECTATVCAVP